MSRTVARAPVAAPSPRPEESRLSLAGWAWAAYEGGRDPYGNLVAVFIFLPYFANTVVGDAVKGQTLLATATTLYSIAVALTAPLLATSAARYGARKPFLLVVTALIIPLIWSLWFVEPHGAGLSVTAALWVLSGIGMLFAYSEVLHNALLLPTVGAGRVALASGVALSMANVVSVLALSFCAWAFMLPGSFAAGNWSFVPATPLFDIDPASAEPSRIVGPIAASLYALLALPLFLLVPDGPRTGLGITQSVRTGLRDLIDLLGHLKGERDATIFLLARMIFTDGMTSVVLFGGVLAAGLMHWTPLAMLAFGICTAFAAAFGGVFGAWLDEQVGPRAAVMLEIMGALTCLIIELGTQPDRILFLWPYHPRSVVLEGTIFITPPDTAYILAGLGIGVFVTAHYASSRTLLTRLVAPEKLPAFFGLYAISGTATVWLGSLLIKLATEALGTQQAGFIPIVALLALGLAGVWFVRGGGKLTAAFPADRGQSAAS